MNAEQRAAESLSRLLELLRGIVEVRDDLASIGSAKQAAGEARARLDDLKRQESEARASLAAVSKKAAEAKSKGMDLERSAAADRDKIVNSAREKAAALVRGAEEKAQKILADANRDRAEAQQLRERLTAAAEALAR
jgi:hypothetical protein